MQLVKCRCAECHAVTTAPIDHKYKYFMKYMGMKDEIVAVNTKTVHKVLTKSKNHL